MVSTIKQKFTKVLKPVSAHYKIRQTHPRKKTQHSIKFLPGVISGVYFSLTKDTNIDSAIPYMFTGISQYSAFISDLTHQKKSNELSKLAPDVVEAHKSYEKKTENKNDLENKIKMKEIYDKFEPYSKIPFRSKKEIILTNIGVSLGEAGIGFAIGFYSTEFTKHILKTYIQ